MRDQNRLPLDARWTTGHDQHAETLKPKNPETHAAETLATELRKATNSGIQAYLEQKAVQHQAVLDGRADVDATLVQLWHDHRHDPGVADVIENLVDDVISDWDSYDIQYLCQVYPRDATPPIELNEAEACAHFGIKPERAHQITDAQWDEYQDLLMAEWMKEPDYDRLSGIQAVHVPGDAGRYVVIACEVSGYSFSGVTFSNASIFASVDAVRAYYSDDAYYVGPA